MYYIHINLHALKTVTVYMAGSCDSTKPVTVLVFHECLLVIPAYREFLLQSRFSCTSLWHVSYGTNVLHVANTAFGFRC